MASKISKKRSFFGDDFLKKFSKFFLRFSKVIIIEVDCSTSPPAVTRLTIYRGPYIHFNQVDRRRSRNLSVYTRNKYDAGSLTIERSVRKKYKKNGSFSGIFLKDFLIFLG